MNKMTPEQITLQALKYYRENFLLVQIYQFKRYNLRYILAEVETQINKLAGKKAI